MSRRPKRPLKDWEFSEFCIWKPQANYKPTDYPILDAAEQNIYCVWRGTGLWTRRDHDQAKNSFYNNLSLIERMRFNHYARKEERLRKNGAKRSVDIESAYSPLPPVAENVTIVVSVPDRWIGEE